MLSHAFDELVGFRVQSAGIQGKHPEIVGQFVSHFDQHDVLGATERNGNVAIVGEGGFQDRPGALTIQFGPERVDISHNHPVCTNNLCG